MNNLNNLHPFVEDEPRDEPVILRRRLPHTTERSVAFVRVSPNQPAGLILEMLAARRIRVAYLLDAPMRLDWWREPLSYGWAMPQWHNAPERRTAVYTRVAQPGVKLDLRLASSWFNGSNGSEDAQDAALCDRAWRRLRDELRDAFGPAVLFATPAQTGGSLFEMALPFAAAVPTLPLHLRQYLWALAHQGRMELLPAPHPDAQLTGLWQYDARWMYAACLGHLPVGPAYEDDDDEYAPHVPGFYEAIARVPDDWRHIGLLPEDTGGSDQSGPVRYPRHPGQLFATFCTGAEIELALAQGWKVTILSRLLWPETNRGPDVARAWITNLKAARARLTTYAARGDHAAGLAAAAVRQISVDTIGRWFAHERERHGMCPLDAMDSLPLAAVPHVEGNVVTWTLTEPTDLINPQAERFSHPEWAGIVWGRCRARLAKMALQLPYDQVVALRTDAIWTTQRPAPAVERTGDGPGTWRIKSVASFADSPDSPEGRSWPATQDALFGLMREAR